jgi:SAM-dependent methyltransferase
LNTPTTFHKACCPLCNGNAMALCRPHPEQSVISDGRLLPHALKKLSCANCGAAFHDSIVSHEDIRRMYGSEYMLAGAAPKSDAARAVAYAQWMRNECSMPRSIFEVGCGSGALLREFSTIWPEAVCFGVDPALPSPDRRDSKLRLERGFVEDVPNDVGMFDLIVAVNVIEHTSSPGKFLASLQARLSPVGRMLIVCPSAEEPNAELLFFDHLYSLTTNSLTAAVAGTPLVARSQSLAPLAIGDFQMVTFDATDRASELALRNEAFSDLWSRRDSYLKAWHDLDQLLLNRSQSFQRLVAFGGGQTAALLRAYAPRTWGRLELIILDDAEEAWTLGIPIDSYTNAVQGLGAAGILIAAAPRAQTALAERLRRNGLQSIRWDDLIAN